MEHTQSALITNVNYYAGPAAASALAQDGYRLLCHDASFVEPSARAAFCDAHPGHIALAEQSPDDVVRAALTHTGVLDTIISNDYVAPPRSRMSLTDATAADIREMFEVLTIYPYLLLKAAIEPMRVAAAGGTIIFITSGNAKRPSGNTPVYGPARAATTALVESAAKTLTRDGIYLYAIGPNFFQHEPHFPAGKWEADDALREQVDREVPLGRLGSQAEMGALIAFLASRRAVPTAGQFLAFGGAYLP